MHDYGKATGVESTKERERARERLGKGRPRAALYFYLEELNLVTALVPSEMACFESSREDGAGAVRRCTSVFERGVVAGKLEGEEETEL